MKRFIISITFIVLGAILLVGCSSQTAAGNSAPTPTLGKPLPAAEGTRTVTLAADGQTITLKAGERFVLMLGEDYTWQVTAADQNIASRVVNIMPVKGSQGVYEAHQAGATDLNATGDPTCRQATPACASPSRAFHIKIVVQG